MPRISLHFIRATLAEKMYRVPQTGPRWPAVGPRFERRVSEVIGRVRKSPECHSKNCLENPLLSGSDLRGRISLLDCQPLLEYRLKQRPGSRQKAEHERRFNDEAAGI